MKKNIRIVSNTLLTFIILFLAVTVAGGYYMTGYALVPDDRDFDYELTAHKMDRRVPGFYTWYTGLRESGLLRDTSIVNDRGFRQHAVFACAADPDSAQGTAVLVHGYTDNIVSMMPVSRMYRDSLNFNILIFDQQFHGQSEGESIQMGWLDRLNAAMWTEVAHNLWHDDFMVVHGVSMGAATTMMLSGDPDPEWVSAYVEDCGYTSVWDQFAKQLREEFGLPAFPLLNAADIICRIRYGWDFKEASSVNQLAKSTKPVLFIHGDGDTYVPTSDIYRCFDAKTQGFKKMYLVRDAGHAQAFEKDQAGYTAAVRDFISSVRGE